MSEVSRHGLTKLHSPPQRKGPGPSTTIIFVHGLFGHPENTWTKNCPSPPSAEPSAASKASQKVFWPRDLLPKVVPNAEIYTWGYDADIDSLASSSQNDIHEHATNLLNDVADLHDEYPYGTSLIFVVHSLGGIVVKDALNTSSTSGDSRLNQVCMRTFGVCFLGTPHKGSSAASLGKVAFRVSKFAGRRPNTRLLQELENSSGTLLRVTEAFYNTLSKHDIKVCSFCEEKEIRRWLLFSQVIVKREHAIIGHSNEQVNSIPYNHSEMVKYESDKNIGFKRVGNLLRRWSSSQHEMTTPEDLHDCLESLDDPAARERYAQIHANHDQTFHWLFEEVTGGLREWLAGDTESNSLIFWINGKPGSGKSTAMKYAIRNPQTQELLSRQDQETWHLVSFFFSERGFEIQKNYLGLLQEVLLQIIRYDYSLFQFVRPRYRNLASIEKSRRPRWDLEHLEQAMLDIMQQRMVQVRLCFFIDALDEHSGNNETLSRFLRRLTESTDGQQIKLKICIASRSWPVFEKHFGTCPSLAIHEHTRRDIQIYTTDRLSRARPLQAQDSALPKELKELTEGVVAKANGVFIWVRLVVDELAKGIQDGTSLLALNQKLAAMPEELVDLYARAIQRLDREYLLEAMTIFEIGVVAFRPLPLTAFHRCTSWTLTKDTAPTFSNTMIAWLASRTGGLLEAVPTSHTDPATGSDDTEEYLGESGNTSYVVQFLHQTMKEYVIKHRKSIFAQATPAKGGEANQRGEELLFAFALHWIREPRNGWAEPIWQDFPRYITVFNEYLAAGSKSSTSMASYLISTADLLSVYPRVRPSTPAHLEDAEQYTDTLLVELGEDYDTIESLLYFLVLCRFTELLNWTLVYLQCRADGKSITSSQRQRTDGRRRYQSSELAVDKRLMNDTAFMRCASAGPFPRHLRHQSRPHIKTIEILLAYGFGARVWLCADPTPHYDPLLLGPEFLSLETHLPDYIRLEVTAALLREGVDSNLRTTEDDLESCPLVHAARLQEPQLVQLLIEHGAHVPAEDTLSMLAATSRSPKIRSLWLRQPRPEFDPGEQHVGVGSALVASAAVFAIGLGLSDWEGPGTGLGRPGPVFPRRQRRSRSRQALNVPEKSRDVRGTNRIAVGTPTLDPIREDNI